MEGKLVVVPQCGLCNRLRVLLSALAVSAEDGVAVRVAWERTDECWADFSQLFVPLDGGLFSVGARRWWERPITRRNLHWPWLVRLLMGYRCQHASFLPKYPGEVSALLRRHGKVYLSGPYSLRPYSRDYAARLRPVEKLQKRVDRLVAQFAPHTVGVHIRRTDNVVSMRHSKVEQFRRAMDAELARQPGTRFYLSTDDEEVKASLKKDYGGKVLTQKTSVRRDTLAGMEEAVVDLWCLAATEKLLGSYWSSFTDTAAEIGGMPLVVVGVDTQS